MVGSPKHLHDLAKIDADVRITCRRCRFEEDWSRDALAKHLHAIGASTVWSEITRFLTCRRWGCGSNDLRALPVPYARRPANLPHAIGKIDARLIGTALKILDDAARTARGAAITTPAVNLALLVVYGYARDKEAARLFWERAGMTGRTVNDSLTQPLDVLRYRLQQRGWLEPPEVEREQPRLWTFPSPAPPGWLAPPGHPRKPANNEREGR